MDWLYTTGTLIRDLRTSRVRRLLSILGVVIGTGAVISSLAVVEGGREQLRKHLDKLGVNMVFLEDRYRPDLSIFVEERPEEQVESLASVASVGEMDEQGQIEMKNRARDRSMSSGEAGRSQSAVLGVLRLRDVRYFRDRFPDAQFIEPIASHWTDVGRTGEHPFGAQVEGGTPAGAIVRDLEIAKGRYLFPLDVERSEKVCVLGMDMAERIFGNGDAVGGYVAMLGSRWRVIGVLKRKGTMMRFDYDRLIIVPISSLHERIGLEVVNALLLKAWDKEAAARIRRDLYEVVVSRLTGRDQEDISVFSQDDLAEQHDKTLRTFKTLTICIAAFSLLVSGIGIMNIMLVSVRERTHEIGVWKAVGATDSDILMYFLAESVFTCIIGGMLGVLLGFVLASYAAGFVAESVTQIGAWTPIFRPSFFVLSLGSSILIGLLSGIFPALVAARLEPTEALRYE